MSPPWTLGPALPFSCALVPLILVAGRVVAVGGTFVQYGLGGVTPDGHTTVAPLGTAARPRTPAKMRLPTIASRLRCEYLVICVLLIGTTHHGAIRIYAAGPAWL